MPTWRIALYSVVAGAGAAWLTFNGVYDYFWSQIPPDSHDGQAGMGPAFAAMYSGASGWIDRDGDRVDSAQAGDAEKCRFLPFD